MSLFKRGAKGHPDVRGERAAVRPGETARRVRRPVPAWKRVLLSVAALLFVVGAGVQVWAWVSPDEPSAPAERSGTGATGDLPVAGFAAGGATADGAAEGVPTEGDEPGGLRAWSPVLARVGFSFFVGFAIAYALRTFIKISIIVIGVVLIGIVGLNYAGVINVNWGAFESLYGTIATWLGEQTTSMKSFVGGQLPSAGSFAAGLVIGFKK